MKRNMILTDIARDIWKTKNRFFSIMAIVALGTGFFAGIKSTTPNMKQTADAYYKESRLSDFHLVSTLGITEDDVMAIRRMNEVKAVMPGYSADLFVRGEGDAEVIMKVISVPLNPAPGDPDYLNKSILKQGKMPYQSGECLLDNFVDGYKIGDIIRFSGTGTDRDLSDVLNITECKIVGRVETAQYISFDRGSASIGNGIVRGFILLPETDFSYEVYTDLYLTLHATANLSAFSQEYQDTIDDFAAKLETIADRRKQLRYDEIYQEALSKIEEGEQELRDNEAKAKKELADAWRKITDGQQELEDAKTKLIEETAKAKQELADAEKDLLEGEATYEKEYADFLKKIEDAQKEIDDGWTELERSEAKIDRDWDDIKENQKLLDAKKQELEEAKAQVAQLEGLQNMLSNPIMLGNMLPFMEGKLDLTLFAILQQYANNPNEDTREAATQTLGSIIAYANDQITAGQQQLSDGQAKLNDGASQLRQGEREINAGRKQLEEAQETLLKEKAKALSEFQDARNELDKGWRKLEDGKRELEEETAKAEKEIEDAQKDLEQAIRDYRKAKQEAEEKIADARLELEDARKELAKLEFPKWYVFDRDDQVGYSGYGEDSERVDKIAAVFPVFFILIAALVCLSTMSRMVEEQRTQIGTWKALGYSQDAIIGKYIVYALAASILGSAIGLSIGLYLFPVIIFNAFRIMYIMPDIRITIDPLMVILSVAAAILCTSVSAAFACRQELMIAPSQLMRPKPPKNGKRVLLEHVPWIWNKLSFNAKITYRNLMRYKGRVLMTMIGIGGCTALMLTGFGLQYSISSIVDRQYGNVFHYDVLGAIDENTTSKERLEIQYLVQGSSYVSDSMFVYQKSIDAKNESRKTGIYLFVPENPDRIASFVSFQDRVTQETRTLSDDGVLITEKLSRLLNVKTGDSITLIENGQNVSVQISGIVENYTFHYVYMTPALYQKTFGTKLSTNMIIANLATKGEETETLFAEELLHHDAILGVAFSRETGKKFNDLIGALNIIVVVIIICAGALAFVVLYNLTNINVNERLRELATIKLLGFYDLEVSSYIYRENTISAILGMLIGLVMGIFLHKFVIATSEVDVVMFNPLIDKPSYWYAAILTMVFTFVVNLALHFRLKRIDMVESLKSVE